MRFLDLCCGMGSFHHAFASLDFNCIGACDVDPLDRATYRSIHNYKGPMTNDIRDSNPSTLSEYDILCGGFSC